MAIFNKKDDFEQESEKADKEAISSIIDTRMVMKGELLFEGKARIDGTVEGNIKGEHLILSEGGKIIGDVEGGILKVYFYASPQVHLRVRLPPEGLILSYR